MKMYVQNLAMLSAVIAFGCNSNKTEPQAEEPKTQTVTTEDASHETTEQTQQTEVKTIEGTVKATNHGKDGFTATIETKGGGMYQATISRANLKDAKQYREFNNNEIVKLTGDSWKMGEDNQLTVREID
jgi:hypothetical protein